MDDKIFQAIALLKEMANGKVFTRQDGYIIGMAENGFVGFVVEEKVSTFSEITFSQLVDTCIKENVVVIPKNHKTY